MTTRMRAIIAGLGAVVIAGTATPAMSRENPRTGALPFSPPQQVSAAQTSMIGAIVRNGTIASLNTTRMVIVHTHKGKAEQLEFILNAETIRKGDLAVGAPVTVHYRTENKKNVATSIQARKSTGFSL